MNANYHKSKNIYSKYIISQKLFYLSLWYKRLSKHEIEKNINI